MASEILGVTLKAGLTNTEAVLLNGVNGHTYTILSITFCETAGAAETLTFILMMMAVERTTKFFPIRR